MRGFPLLNLLAVFGVLGALLIPLLRLNTPARAADRGMSGSGEELSAPAERMMLINLRFAQEPSALEVKAAGKTLEFSGKGLERSARAGLPLHDKALELDVNLSWPAGAAVAGMAEISVAPDGLEERKQNVWAEDGEASEIVRFDWNH